MGTESNRREGKHVMRAAEAFGVNHLWDLVMGPYLVEDTWGMFEAAAILLRSLDPGRNSKFIHPTRYDAEVAGSLFEPIQV